MAKDLKNILLSQIEENKIKEKTPDKLPLNPTAEGWSGHQVRRFLAKSLTDNEGSFLAEFKKKMIEIKAQFEDVFGAGDGKIQEQIDNMILENANIFKDVNYNNINGVLTFTKYDDTTKEVDLRQAMAGADILFIQNTPPTEINKHIWYSPSEEEYEGLEEIQTQTKLINEDDEVIDLDYILEGSGRDCDATIIGVEDVLLEGSGRDDDATIIGVEDVLEDILIEQPISVIIESQSDGNEELLESNTSNDEIIISYNEDIIINYNKEDTILG